MSTIDRADISDIREIAAKSRSAPWNSTGSYQSLWSYIDRLLTFIDAAPAADSDELAAALTHWPEIGCAGDDSTWLECSCGWDQSAPKSVDWVTHIEQALAARLREVGQHD